MKGVAIALILSAMTGPCMADSDAADRQLQAALQCASLASAAMDIEHNAEAARLFNYAVSVLPEALGPLMSIPESQLGPYATALRSRGENFYLGMYFQMANDGIAPLLDGATQNVVPGETADQMLAARKLAAAVEFRNRNCDLVGK